MRRTASGPVCRSTKGALPWVVGWLVLVWAAVAIHSEVASPSAPTTAAAKQVELTVEELATVGDVTAGWFREQPAGTAALPGKFCDQTWLVYIAARIQGRRTGHAWGLNDVGQQALASAVKRLKASLSTDQRRAVTALEIDLAHSFERIDLAKRSPRWSDDYRGLLGVELISKDRTFRLAPTQMIARNLGFDRALALLTQDAELDPSVPMERRDPIVHLFEAQQMLVELDASAIKATPMYRGNTLVPIEAVRRPAVANLSSNLAQWLTTNLQPDGRMVYLYWPSRGEESKANNEIRQWMATLALTRLARQRNDPGLFERARLNLRHNLARSYRVGTSGLGQIVETGGAVKLGAVALAHLALLEHPMGAEFAVEKSALGRTIDHLWQPHGEFHTFLVPPFRSDNVNFYPGEALLLWASLYTRSNDPNLLNRILTTVNFYREWHRTNRNPAFVPWHTQACFLVWEQTRLPAIRDWIFEMNDWLLGVQQWESQREFPDTMGRFYDPGRPFGPPHASSTGVYLEGLIDAWRLAQVGGDLERQERYRRAIVRGLRSVMQLTFDDGSDLFYVSQRHRVFGGVRTTAFNNTIRVDNVQHSLMAALKILEHLPPDEFRP